MRIVVIGGTNFIGPHLCRLLAGQGHDLIVFHRGEHEADLRASARHVHSPAAGIPVLRFPAELTRQEPDLVLHMIPMGRADSAAAVDAFRGRAGRIVGLSSADVYQAYGALLGLEARSPGSEDPLTETSPLRQSRFPYRAGRRPEDWVHDYEKILAEEALSSASDLPPTILRLPAVYGPRDPQRRLEPYLQRIRDRRPAILLGAARARWRWSHGYVDNVAAAIALAVTDDRAKGRVYNVGPVETPSTEAWVRRIGELAGWKGRVVVVPDDRVPEHLRQPHDLRHDLAIDSSRIRRELGYLDPVPEAEGLRRTIAAELAQPANPGAANRSDYALEEAVLRSLEDRPGGDQ